MDQQSEHYESENWFDSQAEATQKGAKATWWARVTYNDPKTGKRHDLQRRGQSKAHARDLLQALLRDIDATEGQAPRNERKSFTELCDYFEKHYVKAASTQTTAR